MSLPMAAPEPAMDQPIGRARAPGLPEVALARRSAVQVWVG
jgi:hypothetical protein